MNTAERILSAGDDSQIALYHRGTVLTHGELRLRARRLASGLLERGYVKGDHIGILAENGPFSVTVYFGILLAGCVAVPFQTEVTEQDFKNLVADAGVKGVFVSRLRWKRLTTWAGPLATNLLPEPDLPGLLAERTSPLPVIDPARDLAALMFTSGSTGAPKGVMITHRNIECNTRDIVSYLGLCQTDRAMVVLPFHYCFGASLLHSLLMAGGTLVLNNDFKLFPEAMLREMQEQECTGFAGVPSTYQILLRKSRFRQMEFPVLRWFQQAGGKLPNPYIEDLQQAFPHVRYYLMYGQTEATARLSYLPPERLADKFGSIGRGLPSTALEVLKPDGSPVMPGSDEVGEIVATGENISPGYWDDPEETSRYFKQGKLHTGDIARVDADGFIFIVERERDMIKSGGNRVSAKEVEDVLAELPQVVEVAVVGVPHDLLGEAIKAFVVAVPSAPLTTAEISKHCRARLPAFKRPEEVVFLERMPHNGSGKVLKRQLAEMQFQAARPRTPETCVRAV